MIFILYILVKYYPSIILIAKVIVMGTGLALGMRISLETGMGIGMRTEGETGLGMVLGWKREPKRERQ